MVLYRYLKENNSSKKRYINKFSYITLIIGSMLLFWSFYPILSFEIYSQLFIQRNINTPIPKTEVTSSLENAKSILGSNNVFSNNLRDFTQAKLWFPKVDNKTTKTNIVGKEYKLSIPKLNINEANVIAGGENLAKSLIQYQPQSVPGEYGNVVIFGHSTLPQLYNTKDYKTIFTYLPSLNVGDKILIRFDDVDYEYEIFNMFIVNPEQVSVLEQKTDASYLTLITCVPPGTYWKRLIIKARLTKLPVEL